MNKTLKSVEVHFQQSLTINLGNYNSTKLELGITLTIDTDDYMEIDKNFNLITEQVASRLDLEADKAYRRYKPTI